MKVWAKVRVKGERWRKVKGEGEGRVKGEWGCYVERGIPVSKIPKCVKKNKATRPPCSSLFKVISPYPKMIKICKSKKYGTKNPSKITRFSFNSEKQSWKMKLTNCCICNKRKINCTQNSSVVVYCFFRVVESIRVNSV